MNIKKLISKGESETLEFKERFDNGTIETIVAPMGEQFWLEFRIKE